MEFTIFSFRITILRTSALERLSTLRVERLARTFPGYGEWNKIPRIKAVRQLVPGTGLREAKEWVDTHFAG